MTDAFEKAPARRRMGVEHFIKLWVSEMSVGYVAD